MSFMVIWLKDVDWTRVDIECEGGRGELINFPIFKDVGLLKKGKLLLRGGINRDFTVRSPYKMTIKKYQSALEFLMDWVRRNCLVFTALHDTCRYGIKSEAHYTSYFRKKPGHQKRFKNSLCATKKIILF